MVLGTEDKYVRRVAFVDRHGNLVDLFEGQSAPFCQTPDDSVNTHTFLNIRPHLLQDLSRQKSDGGSTISNFGILCSSDINQGPGGGMNDIEQTKKGSTIV
jgi:hypothetical protein